MPGFNSIDGLSSGLDTTAIVDAIMQFERRPALLLEVDQAKKQAIISAYQALQAKFLSVNNDLAVLSKTSTFEKAAINVSDESVLTATRGSRVSTGTYNVQVTSLAYNHQIASQGFGMTALTPYTGKYVGYAVGKGKLYLDLEYKIENRKLTASNAVFLDQFVANAITFSFKCFSFFCVNEYS